MPANKSAHEASHRPEITPAGPCLSSPSDPDPLGPAQLKASEVSLAQDVDPATGLSDAEAAARLKRDGPNELRAKPPVPLWRKIVAQFQDALI